MPQSLDIQLQNQSDSAEVYAYITGIALQYKGARVLLKANGYDLYFPESPSEKLQPLQEDCAIPLGPPGNIVTVRIPQMAGGRIWFSRNARLTFLLNPGPALVEPSVLNPSDANINIDFTFAEFTLNDDQLFANISYVDFVSRLPIALTLWEPNGAVQHVSGMAEEGLRKVSEGLKEVAAQDGLPWDKLIVNRGNDGKGPLRILNPTHGKAVGANFDSLYQPLINEFRYRCNPRLGGEIFRIDTQTREFGVLEGYVDPESDMIVIGGEKFDIPTTADILGGNSRTFVTGPSAKRNLIIPRLNAAFYRSAICFVPHHPSHPDTHYIRHPINQYARLLHLANLDGKGYAFSYDDVTPTDGEDRSGKVNAGSPSAFIVAVGGRNVFVGNNVPN